MVNLRQKKNEDAKTYGDRAIILLREKLEVVSEDLSNSSTLANKDVAPVTNIHSRVILEYFINGLKLCDVKHIVKSNNFTELCKAAEYAHNLESNFKSNEILSRRNNILPSNFGSRHKK